MSLPRKQVSNGRPRKQNDLASLSTKVLRLCLQALNLPITGGKATLIPRLNLAIGTKQPARPQIRKPDTPRRNVWHREVGRLGPPEPLLPQNPQPNKQIWRTLVMTLRTLRLVATSTKSWRNFPRTTRPILSKSDLSPLLNCPPYRTPSGPCSINRCNHSPGL